MSQNVVDMETFIVRPANKMQANAIKAVLKALDITFERTTEEPYDSEFVEKIAKSDQEYKEGRFKSIKTENLWK